MDRYLEQSGMGVAVHYNISLLGLHVLGQRVSGAVLLLLGWDPFFLLLMDQSPHLLLLLLDSGDLRLDPCLLLTIQQRLSLLEVMSGHYRYNMNLKQEARQRWKQIVFNCTRLLKLVFSPFYQSQESFSRDDSEKLNYLSKLKVYI